MNIKEKDVLTCEDTRTGMTPEAMIRAVWDHLQYTFAKNGRNASDSDVYLSMSLAVRDRLIHRWMKTMKTYYVTKSKRVYYLSAEYLLGRALGNNLRNLGIYDEAAKILEEYDINIEDILEKEPDPGLGNGGLGRLAACFLDSLATLGYAALGYGIRYEFGIFKQNFRNGWQVETRDPWLELGNPWEIRRMDLASKVHFGGKIVERIDADGNLKCDWIDTETVLGVPYDMPIAGYGTNTVNSLRLWSAQASNDFNLSIFNAGDYRRAVEDKVITETISKVLYPADNNPEGKELRLKQQYFFVSCSIQDIVRRYKKQYTDFSQFADKVAIQLNDTHPAIAIAELMRVLVDIENITWDQAWNITENVFGYTNHTLLPEALERWPVHMFEKLLPRHLKIIYEINRLFLRRIHICYPNDMDIQRRVSIIDETGERYVRMAHLAVIGSHSVNGVAKIHSELVKTDLFPDFARYWPEKFNNKTNGVTPRRWLLGCNPKLAALITEKIGDGWVKDTEKLVEFAKFANDKKVLQQLAEIKKENKRKFIHKYLKGINANENDLFDIQVKRIHEYKRQLLNALHVIHLYRQIKFGKFDKNRVPRTVIFAGKAAPGYASAKLHIKLINDISEIVNQDPVTKGKLRVAMLPNYSVSMAEVIMPAADLSEQISTAGKEASGTGNMKFALNGALTIGTLDGANIEIRERVGEDNFFLFGLTEQEVKTLQREGYNPQFYIDECEDLKGALEMLDNGFFSPDDLDRYKGIVSWLKSSDPYMLCADFEAYIHCQENVDRAYLNQEEWARKSLLNISHMGYFSSDRTIKDYVHDIWKVPEIHVSLDD